jgi:hypothetical protein
MGAREEEKKRIILIAISHAKQPRFDGFEKRKKINFFTKKIT